MKIQRIHIENYKTYRALDLDLSVTADRPIILVGGANGCGKTTLFDGIYAALYGLSIKTPREYEEVFNAGVKNETGMDGKYIVLELSFSGIVLGRETRYRLKRTYMLHDGKVLESVELNMDGNRFVYGSATPPAQRAMPEQIVNNIIAANLPAELSNYFLFDAMKTSDLVKEEQINKLIMNNINSVMGFSKYTQLQKAAEALLAEKKAARLENENQRKEYEDLQRQKHAKEDELHKSEEDYSRALQYADDNKKHYEHLKEGRDSDNVTRDKITQIKESLAEFKRKESSYRQDANAMSTDLEKQVIFPKLADLLRTEVEVVLNEKHRLQEAREEMLTDQQIQTVTHEIVKLIVEKYGTLAAVDEQEIIEHIKSGRETGEATNDRFSFLTDADIDALSALVKSPYVNPFIQLDGLRESLNNEIADIPARKERLVDYQRMLGGTDYSMIQDYEENELLIKNLREKMESLRAEIESLSKQIATYDYDIPQVPDPQYDLLCKLPDFFKGLSKKLLAAKKANIERMMKEQLNINLVIYAGYIGRVELSSTVEDDICFKIFHKNGNEIYLSQLNAGAKQTVMQVLLKVLYELGDYDPPVMIDTVMGVLDKESREVILERYFPDLAQQTILLSTDTEITTEHDFKKIEAYVAKAYTLHRDKDAQCTRVSADYFGLTPIEY